MRLAASLILLLGLAGTPLPAQPARAPAAAAPAATEVVVAPAPAWVEPVAPAAADPAFADRPVQVLLSNSQSFYAADHADHYVNLVLLAQNAQGLQGVGTIVLPWQPGQAELIVHKVHIIRGGTVIDVLANGQRFTLLRRENNLESAMLDGMLTATMQVEGLAVGDMLDIAWSVHRHSTTLPLRGENLFAVDGTQPVRRLAVRQIWPAGTTVQWRGSGLFEHAATRDTRFGTELSVDLADARADEVPAMVPMRLRWASVLQLSQYRDWAEIGAMLAPHYLQAQQLAADSPVTQEIRRIAAASQDPRVRTMAALRLVQDQIRYFALLMGDGNYLPASADQTWTRRYADCKGKVALLLALLHGLGVEAEPVLVNPLTGDSLGERLPIIALFNHVIVRARIDGKSYWLDGTRSGDRALEDLASSTLGWALPVRPGGAALERLPYAPPQLPMQESNIVYDGSSGLGGSIPIRMEQILRGDLASRMRLVLSQAGRDAFIRQLRENMTTPPQGGSVDDIDVRDDPEGNVLTIIISGHSPLLWNPVPGLPSSNGARRFKFGDEAIHWRAQFDRPAGPFHDAPYALPIPYYGASTETVILPNGGRGFTIAGTNFERMVAGTMLSRHVAIANGRAVSHSESRRIEPEITAAAARAATAQFDAINDEKAYLMAPASLLRERAPPARASITTPVRPPNR